MKDVLQPVHPGKEGPAWEDLARRPSRQEAHQESYASPEAVAFARSLLRAVLRSTCRLPLSCAACLLGAEIVQTDIKASVESIMAPAIPIALRLSGHLLLGVCRIYSRKVVYLYNESNEAMVKTKMVSASTTVRYPAPAVLPLPPARVS